MELDLLPDQSFHWYWVTYLPGWGRGGAVTGHLPTWSGGGVGQGGSPTNLAKGGGGGVLPPCGQTNTSENIAFSRTMYVVGRKPVKFSMQLSWPYSQ